MPSADELRNSIAENRTALRAAIEALDGASWEQTPEGDEWTRRKIAEHAIGSERYFAGIVAGAMQGKAPERVPLELASAQEALAAHEQAAADADRVLRYVEDRDLEKAAELNVETTHPKNVLGTMAHAADHLSAHTRQLNGGA